MKKALFILTLAIVAVSCNNDGAGTGDLKDSVMETIDSAADAKIDSIQETTDTVKNRLDNAFDTVGAAADTSK